MHNLFAVIDFGTNTARLLIGYIAPEGDIVPLSIKRHITRLGGGFTDERGISSEALDRSIIALKDFGAEISSYKVNNIKAVATSAVRDAANKHLFCEEIYNSTGIYIDVIDGLEEGYLTLRGVLSGLSKLSKYIFVFDIGGGSTEYIFAIDGVLAFSKSLPLGVVRLTEGKISSSAIADKICRELYQLQLEIDDSGFSSMISEAMLVATAGTATTLAAINFKMINYNYNRINGSQLDLRVIENIQKQLDILTLKERLQIPGMEAGREDLIMAGIQLTVATMKLFNKNMMTVSTNGLLEGLFLSIAESNNSIS